MQIYRKIATLLFMIINTCVFATGNTEYNIFSNNQQIFISVSCIETIEKQDRDFLLDKYPQLYHEPFYEPTGTGAEEGDVFEEIYWYSDFSTLFLDLRTLNREEKQAAYIRHHFSIFKSEERIINVVCNPYSIFCTDFELLKNQISFNVFLLEINRILQKDFINTVIDSVKSNKVNHKAKIVFDGDYLDFYIDDIFIHKFCRINKETLEQYDNLIKDGECDLSKVTWPRYADGTSDYDDKIIMPEAIITKADLKKFENERK